jgi:hypothetical protein
MPISFIKKWIFQKAVKSPVSPSDSSDNAIGVFINYPQNTEEIEQLTKVISQTEKTKSAIHILAFINQKEVTAAKCKYYSLKELKWAGYPESTDVNEFLGRKYQKFYYLSPTYEDHQHYILSKVQGKFKAGVHHKGIEPNLSFMIDAPYKNSIESYKVINETLDKIIKR